MSTHTRTARSVPLKSCGTVNVGDELSLITKVASQTVFSFFSLLNIHPNFAEDHACNIAHASLLHWCQFEHVKLVKSDVRMEPNVVRMDRANTCSFTFIVITCLRQFSARALYPSCPLVRLLSFTKYLIYPNFHSRPFEFS